MAQYTKEFKSIHEFYDYLCNTPFNDTFRWARHSSTDNDYSFSKTHSFEQAVDLMKNGWSDMSEKLTQKLKVAAKPAPQMKPRNVLSVAGYQPVVALYLAGVPTNMVDKQLVAVKSKVISVTKLIDYNGGVDADVIEEESIKAFQVVKKLEAQGYRVNLNVALGSEADWNDVICKVRIKNANEKLNISKLAFPMVHPSMLRRLMFRYIEVCPDVTNGYRGGYGRPCSFRTMKKAFPDDIILPSIWDSDVTKIESLEDLVASV